MQPSGNVGGIVRMGDDTGPAGVARPAVPLLARLAGKFVLDIMPTALASAIGGFLLTHYQFNHAAPQLPALEQVTPASAEMMALVRDEHAMIAEYLKAQITVEKTRQAASEAAAASPASETKHDDSAVAAAMPVHRVLGASVATRSAAVHSKPRPAVADAVPHAPLVIAAADAGVGQSGNPLPSARLARDPNSLLAKTLDLKDNVVAATRHVVGMIGDVVLSPFGQSKSDSLPAERQYSSAS